MKKLIKLLFPKTYDSIYREGFSLCYEIYVTPEDNEEYYGEYYEDELDDPEEYYEHYPEEYWEELRAIYGESEDTTGE